MGSAIMVDNTDADSERMRVIVTEDGTMKAVSVEEHNRLVQEEKKADG